MNSKRTADWKTSPFTEFHVGREGLYDLVCHPLLGSKSLMAVSTAKPRNE